MLPLTFIEPANLLVKNPKFQKGKRRLPTGREAAELEERATHQKRIRNQREEKNLQKDKDVAEQINLLQDGPAHLPTDIVEISDEEETMDTTCVSLIPPQILSSSNSDSASFCDMDDYEQIPIDHVDGISPTFEPL